MTTLQPVTADRVLDIWPVVREPLQLSCDRGLDCYNPDAYLPSLLKKEMQLWVVEDYTGSILGVSVTQLLYHGTRKMCYILALAGEGWPKWRSHLTEIEQWAASNGCVGMHFVARPGFKKFLSLHGYSVPQMVYYKELVPMTN